MLGTIALAAVLLAGPAAAQETGSQTQQSQQKSGLRRPRARSGEKAQGAKGADQHSPTRRTRRGYGYGTPSGTEANSTAKLVQ